MAYKNPTVKIALFFLLTSALPLGGAYFMQYALNAQPCLFCLYQRVPFFVMMITSLITIIFPNKTLCKINAGICCLALLINSGIAFFHAGVEYKIFTSYWCSTRSQLFESTPQTIDDIRKQLTGTGAKLTIVDCNEAPLRILGLSLSGWNFVYCVTCIIIAFIIRYRIKKSCHS